MLDKRSLGQHVTFMSQLKFRIPQLTIRGRVKIMPTLQKNLEIPSSCPRLVQHAQDWCSMHNSALSS